MDLIERLVSLWFQPLPADDIVVAKFRELYQDPVLVNGAPLSASALVARARAQQAAFSELSFEIDERVELGNKLVIAFRQRGRHTGPLVTPLGVVPATGKSIERQIIDVLTLKDGKVSEIRVVGDEFGALLSLGVLALR